MIGKKIEQRRKKGRKKGRKEIRKARLLANKALKIRNLVRYIRLPESKNSKEKCVYSNARGFFSEGPEVQIAEMIALAEEATRSENPVDHYMLSWREGETPSVSQVEEAVTIFLDELGLIGHQCVYGLHADTKNLHIHIAVNRVHPESLKCVEINNGFQIEAVHRAVARIEHVQGWKPQENARYKMMEGDELARVIPERQRATEPSQARRDMENRTGEKSAVRIAKENVGDIFKTAASWQELHTQLAAINLRYQRTGSGAVIFSGDIGMKASSIDRAASLAKLETRLGIFEPHHQDQNTVVENQLTKDESKKNPSPLVSEFPGWEDYSSQNRAQNAAKKSARLALRKRHDLERADIEARHRAARTEFFASRSWVGRGAEMNAFRSVLAAEQAAENAAMRERQAMESNQLTKRYPPIPSFKDWLHQHQRPDIANAWRHRANLHAIIGHSLHDIPAASVEDIRAFKPRIQGKQVEYVRRDFDNDLLLGRQPSFVDYGSVIRVHDWRNEDTILAALQLAAQKWGSFSLWGSHDYKALCVRLAAEHGLRIKNPELQADIKHERDRLAQEHGDAQKSPWQKEVEKVISETKADRYQITNMRTFADGSTQLMIYGKAEGYTAQELSRKARYIDGIPSDAKITPLYDQPRTASTHQQATQQAAPPIEDRPSSQISQQPPASEKSDKHGKRPKATLGATKF